METLATFVRELSTSLQNHSLVSSEAFWVGKLKVKTTLTSFHNQTRVFWRDNRPSAGPNHVVLLLTHKFAQGPIIRKSRFMGSMDSNMRQFNNDAIIIQCMIFKIYLLKRPKATHYIFITYKQNCNVNGLTQTKWPMIGTLHTRAWL